MTIKLTINGVQCEAQPGATILDVAEATGIEVPSLCHHPDLTPVGSCRLCMVEVDGWRDPVAACVTPVEDGFCINTETERLTESRRDTLELLLADYHDAGYPRAGVGSTEFERWVNHYDAQSACGGIPAPRFPVDSDSNPFVWVDLNKCILCTRCVRACDEVQGRFVWGVGERGRDTKIIAGTDTSMLDARCESCGACAAYCPTGALDDRMSMGCGDPDKLVRTTCTYCGVGCQFDLNVKDDRVIRVTSTPDAPVNGLSLCVKGRYGFDFIHHDERLKKPMVRRELLDGTERPASGRGEWVDTDWETALNLVANRLASIREESGPDAIGVFSSAKCSNEENYLMQKFARQVIGTNNIDHCARLCHSSTVAGLAMCFGSGAMSNSMDDVSRQAEAFFIIGSNTTEQHPVFGAMIRQAVQQRGAKLVVADPRRIDITEFATLHLQQKPGTDVALINGLMHIILQRGWQDSEFIASRCEDFEEFAATVAKYPTDLVAGITGVSADDLFAAAEILATSKPMAVIWAMGITQHTTGVINVLSLGNLQMLLGNMGVPGGGVNPLRGQNNVQGACDMGGLPNVYPGYQKVASDESRQKFQSAWELRNSASGPSFVIPESNGLTITEMIDAAGDGRIRSLYILGENPVLTDPDSNHVRRCLTQAEFVVLQEIFPSETAAYADVLLPGTTFAERTGTFTNTERRIQLFRQAIRPIGESRPDWKITSDLANFILKKTSRVPTGDQAAWPYQSSAEIMAEIAAVTPSYAGVNHERLEAGERLQWPVADTQHPATRILHVGQFARGTGKFHAVDHLPPRELPDDDYPMLMTTGRVIYHWHGGEMTRRSAGLTAVCPQSFVEISPADGREFGIDDNDTVLVTSRRGEMRATAAITDRVTPGLVFGNFHFAGEQNVNNVTIAALDPVAKIPEYKVCAVRLAKANT